MMSGIQIDLQLHKAIEARRLTLAETQTDIVRRIFGIGIGETTNLEQVEELPPSQRAKHTRRGGTYPYVVNGSAREAYGLKGVLKDVLIEMEKAKKGSLVRLSQYRTPRGRRIIARRDVEIYPGNQELVEKSAERLNDDWWYDTNISNSQLKKYISTSLEYCQFDSSFVRLDF
jgi:hypothetical protein